MLGIGDGLVFYKPGNLIPTPQGGRPQAAESIGLTFAFFLGCRAQPVLGPWGLSCGFPCWPLLPVLLFYLPG